MEQSKNEWPKDAVFKLIELWESYDLLYNTKNRFYHNKHVRADTLNKIASKLKPLMPNITGNDVKLKITNLRGQFTKQLWRLRGRSTDIDDGYEPSIYWFDRMQFLRDHITVRKTLDTESSQNTDDRMLVPKKRRLTSTDDDFDMENTTFFKSSPDSFIENSNLTKSPPSTITSEIPITSHVPNIADVSSIQNITSLPNILHIGSGASEEDIAFAKYLQTTLASIKNEKVKNDLCESIMKKIFEAKRLDRRHTDSLSNFVDGTY